MDNVWIHAKSCEIWDLIIARLKQEGYWGKVVQRIKKPSLNQPTLAPDCESPQSKLWGIST